MNAFHVGVAHYVIHFRRASRLLCGSPHIVFMLQLCMRNSTYRPLPLHTKEKYESKLSVVGLQKHNAQPGLDKPHMLAVFKSLNVGRYFASQPGPTLPEDA